MIHNQKKKSINRKRHRNHRDDRTSRHRCQNNFYTFQKLKNIEKKHAYDEETNRGYLRTQIKFLKMENTVSDIKNILKSRFDAAIENIHETESIAIETCPK